MSTSNRVITLSDLTGSERAAIFLLSLQEELAAQIFKTLSQKEIQVLTGCATRLPPLDEALICEIREEFMGRLSGQITGVSRRTRERVRSILTRFLDQEQVEKYLHEMMISEDLSDGFDAIRFIDAKTLAAFMADEHPQTVALILAHLDVQKAAQVLPLLPTAKRSDIVMRIARLDRISPQVVKNLQEVFVHEIISSDAVKSKQVGGAESVAELMNSLDSQTMQGIFGELEQSDPGFCDEIRKLMFVFSDLSNLDDRSLQQIIKEVTNDTLTLALKTASSDLREKIFRNISSRAAQLIKEELEIMGPVKLSEVEASQQEIVAIARRLESEGKVTIAGRGGSDELV